MLGEKFLSFIGARLRIFIPLFHFYISYHLKPLIIFQVQLDVSVYGFCTYEEGCPEPNCRFTRNHYHCTQPRCFFATDKTHLVVIHSKEFHDNIEILEGFVFYDRNIDCQSSTCTKFVINFNQKKN